MKTALAIIGGVLLLTILSIGCYTCNQVQTHVTDNAFISYEEYQEIYNTCKQIDENLCNIESVPDSDKMFEQFSKSQRLMGLRNNMNRWIEEYNAKSKMWNRALWKSKQLPYQLQGTDFKCY